jgi:hypothetical protein
MTEEELVWLPEEWETLTEFNQIFTVQGILAWVKFESEPFESEPFEEE